MATGPTRKGWFLALALACAGCQSAPAAITATIVVDPAARATCLRLEVKSGETVVLSSPVPRAASVRVGITQAQALSGKQTLELRARGYLGKGCDEPLKLNLESEVKLEHFVAGQVRQVTLALDAPAAQVDADRDGFRSDQLGGTDCDDGNAMINPEAFEACDNQLDDNCDALVDCADPGCFAAVCGAAGRTCQSDCHHRRRSGPLPPRSPRTTR